VRGSDFERGTGGFKVMGSSFDEIWLDGDWGICTAHLQAELAVLRGITST
jgi:hypothetical protein